MGFFEGLMGTLDTLGKVAHATNATRLVHGWMEANFQDMAQLEATVDHFVRAASTDELRSVDAAMRHVVKTNAFAEQKFERAMWLFASLHGSWSVRLHQQNH